MLQEAVQTSWLFLAAVAVGIIIAIISSARTLSILGFTSKEVRVLLAKVLRGYRKQSLPDVLEALRSFSRSSPESGLLSFMESGKNPSLADFGKATNVANIYFNARIFHARQATALIRSTAVMLCFMFFWKFTLKLQATLTGISMERKTETWVLAERAKEVLALAGPAIGIIALMFAVYFLFQFRLNARTADWQEFSQQIGLFTKESPSSPE